MLDKIVFNKIVRQVIREKINIYADLLRQDFKNQKEYAKLASQLFLSSFDISEWVKNLSTIDFGMSSYNGTSFKKEFFNFKEIDNITFLFKEIRNINTGYHFFSKLIFKNFDELESNNPGYYYIHDKNIISKIDSLLFSYLKDFTKEKGKGSVYSKQISENVFLNFDSNRKRNNFNSIEQYFFPDLSLQINDIDYKFSSETDLNTLLLIPGQTYLIFYANSNEIIKDKNGEIVQVIRKEDEPITYKSENLEGYFVANSPENIVRYNKFIYLTIELFIHYFRVFEKWVTNILLPTLLNTLAIDGLDIGNSLPTDTM